MILENIWWKVVDSVLSDIYPSDIILTMLLIESIHQNYQAVLAAVSISHI